MTHDDEAQQISARATQYATRYLRAVDEQCWMARALMEYTSLLKTKESWVMKSKRGLVRTQPIVKYTTTTTTTTTPRH